MKKIFLYAYDKQNLGDDLFVRTISERYSSVQFFMWSDKDYQTSMQDISNLRVLDKNSLLQKVLTLIKPSLGAGRKAFYENRCDAVLYIGGSIFIEYDNWEMILTWWEYEASRHDMYVLGANFGPYKTEAYRAKMAAVFSKMKDICFRERYSQALFDEVNVARFAPDILFGYPMPRKTGKRKQVFVSVIDCCSEDHLLVEFEKSYIGFIVQLIKDAAQSSYDIILSSFCRKEGDEKGIDKILACATQKSLAAHISICNYTGNNSAHVLQNISNSELVVATRFHASVLGFAAGNPVLPVIYSDKTRHMLEECGFTGVSYDIRKPAELCFSDIINNLNNQKMAGCKILAEQSENHFIKLDEVLYE